MSFKFFKKKEDNAVTRKRMKDEMKHLDNIRDKEKNYYNKNPNAWMDEMQDLLRPVIRTINVPDGVTIRMGDGQGLQPRRGYQPDDHAEHVARQQAGVQNQMQQYQQAQQFQINAQQQAQQYQGAGQIINYTGQDRPAANTGTYWFNANPGHWTTVQLADDEGDNND